MTQRFDSTGAAELAAHFADVELVTPEGHLLKLRWGAILVVSTSNGHGIGSVKKTRTMATWGLMNGGGGRAKTALAALDALVATYDEQVKLSNEIINEERVSHKEIYGKDD